MSGWADDRAHAMSLLRSYIKVEIRKGRRTFDAVNEVRMAIKAVEQEAMIEYDLPGVRYWYLPECEEYWSTMPGDPSPLEGTDLMANLVIELTRHEFLGRQQIYLGVGDNLI